MPFHPWRIICQMSTSIYIGCSPVSPPRGARDETLLSWNVPLRGSGKTTHSGRYHRKRACDSAESPFTPRRGSATLPSGGTRGAMGPYPFAPFRLPVAFESEWTPVLSCNFFRLFHLHPFVSTWLHPRGTATEGDRLPVEGMASGRVLGIDWSPRACRN